MIIVEGVEDLLELKSDFLLVQQLANFVFGQCFLLLSLVFLHLGLLLTLPSLRLLFHPVLLVQVILDATFFLDLFRPVPDALPCLGLEQFLACLRVEALPLLLGYLPPLPLVRDLLCIDCESFEDTSAQLTRLINLLDHALDPTKVHIMLRALHKGSTAKI